MSNIYNFFKFLEKKKGTKTPFNAKLLYAPNELTDEDLNVEGNLDLSHTKITSLPDNLKVGLSLYLKNTPIAKKYSEKEIRKMIEKKGGYVKRNIYV